jgi:hypothetical protein
VASATANSSNGAAIQSICTADTFTTAPVSRIIMPPMAARGLGMEFTNSRKFIKSAPELAT